MSLGHLAPEEQDHIFLLLPMYFQKHLLLPFESHMSFNSCWALALVNASMFTQVMSLFCTWVANTLHHLCACLLSELQQESPFMHTGFLPHLLDYPHVKWTSLVLWWGCQWRSTNTPESLCFPGQPPVRSCQTDPWTTHHVPYLRPRLWFYFLGCFLHD